MTGRSHLILLRLVILGGGITVYDEKFHRGVNIIRGENGSGKSTICDMIFYVLGGEGIEWTDEAAACDWVHAEFSVSGEVLSLRREVVPGEHPSISACEGPLDLTLSNLSGWVSFGRIRSTAKESFSQFMFDRIGLPRTKSSDSLSNITMHQALRLIYGDQNTDCTSLFRKERDPFGDRHDVRRTIGEMFLGIDDLMGHELRQQLIDATRDHAAKKSRHISLLEAAEKTDPNFRLTNYDDQIAQAERERFALEANVAEIAERNDTKRGRSREDGRTLQRLQAALAKANDDVARLNEEWRSLSRTVEDSLDFTETLKRHLDALKSANETREIVGQVDLSYCPVCLADLADNVPDCCPLCKAETHGDAVIGGRLRYEQELKHQIRESEGLLAKRTKRLAEIEEDLKASGRLRTDALMSLRQFVSPIAQFDAQVAALIQQQGYLKRKIEDLARMSSLKEEVERLETSVDEARSLQAELERRIKKRRDQQEDRREHCEHRVSALTLEVLHQDVLDQNQDSLQDADGLVFSFEKDFLSVRTGRLSASTQAFLKNSFYLGLLRFAAEDAGCRLPFFFLLDNTEDKGMTPDRFRNYHNLLIRYSGQIDFPHQVIITTSYISSDLEGTEYCVGPAYNRPPYSLDLKGEWGKGEEADMTAQTGEDGSGEEDGVPGHDPDEKR